MLLLFLSSFWFIASVYAGGVPIKTIVDILSSRAEFSTLVGLLQKHDLITLINQSHNSTFLAPMNSAFAAIDAKSITRDQLLYHFLNETVVLSSEDTQLELVVPSYLTHRDTNVYVHLKNGNINSESSRIIEEDIMASPDRGVVHAISDLLSVPQSLCSSLAMHHELSIFSQLASIGDRCQSMAHNITLFAPHNAVFERWKDIELSYMLSAYGQSDRDKLFNRHLCQGILTPQSLPATIEMRDGSEFLASKHLELQADFGNFDGAFESWGVTTDGIINIYAELLSDGSLVEFNAEKYVLALDGYNFAREVFLYGYGWLLDGSYQEPLTVLAHRSHTPGSAHSVVQDMEVHTEGKWKFRAASVLYQFIRQTITYHKDDKTRLVDSAMTLKGSSYPQRIHYTSHSSGSMSFNWQPVVSEAYEIGNTTILVVEVEIPVLPTFTMALGPLFMSSHSLNFLEDLGLVNLPLSNSWTLLLPSREAWERQSLLMTYMKSQKTALRKFFNTMIFSKPFYSDSSRMEVKNLEGQTEVIDLVESSDSASGFAINISDSVLQTDNVDVLFDNGVAHIVNEVVLPSGMEITPRDLILAGGREDFITLLEEREMDYVLDPKLNYTIIVPNPKALKLANYTLDNPLLDKLLKLHIIEGDNSAGFFDGEPVKTAENENLVMSWVSGSTLAIRLASGLGQAVYVSEWANSHGEKHAQSTVLFVDSFISPDWLKSPIIQPPFRLKAHTLLLLGIVVGLILMSLFLVAMVYLFTDEKSLDEQQALLDEEAVSDSEQSPTQPIRTQGVSQDRQYGNHLNLP